MYRSSIRPASTASPDTASRAPHAPRNTLTGSSYLATRLIVSSCERSPHSAAKSTRNEAPIALSPLFGSLALAAYSSSCCFSTSSAPGAARCGRGGEAAGGRVRRQGERPEERAQGDRCLVPGALRGRVGRPLTAAHDQPGREVRG